MLCAGPSWQVPPTLRFGRRASLLQLLSRLPGASVPRHLAECCLHKGCVTVKTPTWYHLVSCPAYPTNKEPLAPGLPLCRNSMQDRILANGQPRMFLWGRRPTNY